VSDQDLNDLLKAFDNPHHCYPQRLVDAIRLLVKERDEARRMCCEFAAMVDSADTVVMYVDSNRFHEIAMKYMKSRGWDCFPQEDSK